MMQKDAVAKLGKEKLDLKLYFEISSEVLKAAESSFFSSERGKRQGKVKKGTKWKV